jgi:hypothetical protein
MAGHPVRCAALTIGNIGIFRHKKAALVGGEFAKKSLTI